MNTISLISTSAGLILGTFHAVSLWRASHRPLPHATMLRLASVAGFFIAAALLDRILPVAAGWGCAFPLTSAVLYFRDQTWTKSRSSAK